MPPSDQEPRYQLVDSNGNVVGSLFGDGSGNVVIADETDTQTTFDSDGISTPTLEATEISITNIASRIFNSSIQTIPNNADTTVEYDSESYDPAGWADLSNNQIQVSEDGYYLVTSSVELSAQIDDGSRVFLKLQKNGSGFSTEVIQTGTSANVSLMVSDVLDLSATDTISTLIFHDSSADVDTNAGERKVNLTIGKLG